MFLVKRSREIVVREQFGRLLTRLGLLGTAIEIGSWRGDFAIDLLANWDGKCLHCIDPWRSYADYKRDCLNRRDLDKDFRDFKIRTAPFANRIVCHRAMSHDVAGDFDDETIDFVYIDGNHTYWYTLTDCRLYWPKVRPGGILAGHDFDHGPSSPWKDDVYPAVCHFFEPLALPVLVVTGDAHSWYVHKPIEERA